MNTSGSAGMYERFYIWVMQNYRRYCEKKQYRHYRRLIGKHRELTPLTAEQKRRIRELWAPKGRFNYDTHELVYWTTGEFDPRVVPELYIRLDMEMDLNNQMGKVMWGDKNMCDMLLPDVNLPYTVVRDIDGELYDHEYRYLTPDRALEVLREVGDEKYFFKPAVDSGAGKGIHLIDDPASVDFGNLGSNWVIQRLIKPHEDFRRLNSTAVTMMRLITFYVDGEVYLTSSSIRIGMEGAIKDYTALDTGDGSIIAGINDDGTIKDFGYMPNGRRCSEAPNGYRFGGMKIPAFAEACELVKKLHVRFPHFRFLGWDVTIDEDGRPLIIEYNINGPGVLYYQYANGSLFGGHFDEIYNALENKRG